MKLSARNVIEGTITRIVRGPVSTEVTLRVAPRIDIVSVISTGSARALKLRKGGTASAVIKASSVMLGVD